MLRNTFLTYFLCVFLLLAALLGVLFASHIRSRQGEYTAAYEEKANHAAQMLEEQFAVIYAVSNDYYHASWYQKYISRSDVFRSEFDIIRRLNIVQEISFRVALLPLVDDILILNAETGGVICRYGWFGDVGKYSGSYTPLDISAFEEDVKSTDVFGSVKALRDDCRILSYPDFNPGSNSRIAVLIRDRDVLDYLQSVEYSTFQETEIDWQGVLPERDEPGVCAVRIANPGIVVSFHYPSFAKGCAAEVRLYACFLLTSALLLSALLGALFSYLFARPLQEMLTTLALPARATLHDAYRGLSEHIDSMAEENQRIRAEAFNIVDTLRADLLLHAMRGENIRADISYFDTIFPWLYAGEQYFLLILQKPSERAEALTREDALKLDIFEGYSAWLVWAENGDRRRGELLEALGNDENVACSACYSGYDELTACYRDALEQTLRWRIPVTLPDSLALLNALQAGDLRAGEEILSKYRSAPNNGPACIWFHDLLRSTLGRDPQAARQDGWSGVDRLLEECCAPPSEHQENDVSGSYIAQTMSNMIREHFDMPDLSLKYFANQFNISVSALSKLFSQATGEYFSAALQEVRMKRAMELLSTAQGVSIAQVASSCGYENYLSFKRAFTRYTGMSPREYRDIHMTFDHDGPGAR